MQYVRYLLSWLTWPLIFAGQLMAFVRAPPAFWCDHLFGMFRQPLDEPFHEVGIEPDQISKNLFVQLASPLLWPVLTWAVRRQQRRLAP